ncbi:MAG: hypothetical protein OEX22_07925 [Cyclobacteriaceae bacterium]|nr:hypothetical protein [Cyclobacteriaceae bacterium]
MTLTIDSLAQSKEKEILDARIIAFNMRDIEQYLYNMHDSVRIVAFPNTVHANNIEEMRELYTLAFNAKNMGGTIRVLARKKFGEYYIQEEWLEKFESEPVTNYTLYKFKDDQIIEIIYLPANWKMQNN